MTIDKGVMTIRGVSGSQPPHKGMSYHWILKLWEHKR